LPREADVRRLNLNVNSSREVHWQKVQLIARAAEDFEELSPRLRKNHPQAA
jgi:hypothetical protein